MKGTYREGLQALRRDYSREIIARTLSQTGGNKSRAAQKLGIKREQLYDAMKKLDFPPPPEG
jgi:DNA-binding NtrC family response regulator